MRIAGTPPENSTSSIMWGPAGVTVVSCGVSRDSRSNSARGRDTPASWAMARRCSTELEDPPRARSTRMAFSKAARVRILRGVIPFRTNSMTVCPVAYPMWRFLDMPARAVAHPGRDMPNVSVRHAIVLAV